MQQQIKENFCSACITVPLSMISGVTAVTVSNNNSSIEDYIFWKRVYSLIGVMVTLAIFLYGFHIFRNGCNNNTCPM